MGGGRQSSADVIGTVPLAGDEAGEGEPPVVLLHGLGGSRHVWDDVTMDLSTGRRVVRLELRGHGQTGGPDDPAAYTVAAAAADLAAALRERSLQGAPLVAHSLGGTVALWAALRYPDLFGRLILLNTYTGGADRERAAYTRQVIRQFERLGPEAAWAAQAVNRKADRFLGERFRSDEAFAAVRHSDAMAMVPAAFVGFLCCLIGASPFVPWLWQLRQEVVLLAADGDEVMYPEMTKIAAVVPGAELEVLPGCGHNAMMERPGEFISILKPVLAAARRDEFDEIAASP